MAVPRTLRECREYARRVRRMAQETSDRVERDILLKIAAHYDKIALALATQRTVGQGLIMSVAPAGIW